MIDLNWQDEAIGIWRTCIGEQDDFNPLAVAGIKPRHDALKTLPKAVFPFDPAEITAEHINGNLVLRFPLDAAESLFGLGLQLMRINHRGRTRSLRVNSDPRQDTGETHAPVPFLVSSKGYGILVNSARILTFYCGSTVRKDCKIPPKIRERFDPDWEVTPTAYEIEIVIPGDAADIFIFGGKTALEVVQRYNLYCGGGTLPPRWGLGFWYRPSAQWDDEQVTQLACELREKEYPCDVIGLESSWHSWAYPTTFDWNPDKFPQPEKFLKKLKAEGFEVNLWENVYISPESSLYTQLEPYAATHTVWGGLAPDYSLPEVQKIFLNNQRSHAEIGVSGFKIDEVDGSELTANSWMYPAQAQFPSGRTGEEMRQVYGLLLQKMTGDMFKAQNRRTYGMVRASNAGASALPYVLYSDLYDHREFIRGLINASFSGLLWTPEVRDADTAEEWVRRMQTTCFSPLAVINAWESLFTPWEFSDVAPIIKDLMNLRMRLIPYLYSAFARYHFEGIPPFRAMALEFGGTLAQQNGKQQQTAYGIATELSLDDQYMMGDSLLVAPLFVGEQWRDIVLPEGDWYDFDTGNHYAGGQTIRIYAALDKVPVFARGGAIIPLMPVMQHVPSADTPLHFEVRHYGAHHGHFRLYDDDGETFAYESGDYNWIDLSVSVDENGQRQPDEVVYVGERKAAQHRFEWVFYGGQ